MPFKHTGGIDLSLRKSSLATKQHTLAICARLFLEQGYRETTIKQITTQAGISNSSFQNFFRSKEGVLAELVQIVFQGQFTAAQLAAGEALPLHFTYALETTIQLVLTEQNEKLRELYIAAYAQPETVEYIHESTARELLRIFGARFPGYSAQDFYELEIGSAGLMSSYMAKPCGNHFPLERKIQRFLTSALRIYRVSEEEIEQTLAFLASMDIENFAATVLQQLFSAISQRFGREEEAAS